MEFNVPMLVGVVKLPVELDNCAVKTFPALKFPLVMNGTLMLSPGQNEDDESAEVEMVSVVDDPTKSDCQIPLP